MKRGTPTKELIAFAPSSPDVETFCGCIQQHFRSPPPPFPYLLPTCCFPERSRPTTKHGRGLISSQHFLLPVWKEGVGEKERGRGEAAARNVELTSSRQLCSSPPFYVPRTGKRRTAVGWSRPFPLIPNLGGLLPPQERKGKSEALEKLGLNPLRRTIDTEISTGVLCLPRCPSSFFIFFARSSPDGEKEEQSAIKLWLRHKIPSLPLTPREPRGLSVGRRKEAPNLSPAHFLLSWGGGRPRRPLPKTARKKRGWEPIPIFFLSLSSSPSSLAQFGPSSRMGKRERIGKLFPASPPSSVLPRGISSGD